MNSAATRPLPAEDSVARAKRYTSEKIRLSLLSTALTFLYLVAWVLFARPVAAWCEDRAYHLCATQLDPYLWPPGPPHPIVSSLILASLLIAGRVILSFPLSYYGGFAHEHRYGLSAQRFGSWLADWLKAALLGAVFTLASVAWFTWAVRQFDAWWVFVAFAGWLVASLLLDVAFPILILPLFIKLTPLDRPDLAERLGKLAAAAGFRMSGLYRAGFAAKTNKANAFLMGLGPTRRIALADTLVDRCTPEEIESVFAHELGHHAHRHLWLGLLGGAVAAWLVLGLLDQAALEAWVLRPLGCRGIGDPAALPIIALLLTLVGFLGAPVANLFSRGMEAQADRYALAATRNPRAFVSLMEKLAAQNLSDPSPSPLVEAWFYSHPPIAKRIAMADAGPRKGDPARPSDDPRETTKITKGTKKT